MQNLQQQSLHSVGCSAVQLLHRGTPLLACCACTSISSREKHSRWAVCELLLQHIPLVGGALQFGRMPSRAVLLQHDACVTWIYLAFLF